mmetsp:Transcript_71693/g.134080  ORF Transcript_71693/g.134080 Transcript_71693/m.134080 type:complete len:393 (+) Transcript_71693:52-1230(+)
MGQTHPSELPQKFFESLPFPGRDGKVAPPDPQPSSSSHAVSNPRATESPEQLRYQQQQAQQQMYRMDQGMTQPMNRPPFPWAGGQPMPPGVGGDAFGGWGPPRLAAPQLPPLAQPGEAEAELRRKSEEIMTVAKEIQSVQAELQRLSLPPAPLPLPEVGPTASETALREARIQQARSKARQAKDVAAQVSPTLEDLKEKLAKTTKVTRKLNAWFVENAERMNIQDPSLTPSAYLERLLESAQNRMEVLAAGVYQVTGASPPQPAVAQQQDTSSRPPAMVVHQPQPPAPYQSPAANASAQQPPQQLHDAPVAHVTPVGSQVSVAVEAAPRSVPPPSTHPRVPAVKQPSVEDPQQVWPAAQSQSQAPIAPAAPYGGGGGGGVAMWVRDPDAGAQ